MLHYEILHNFDGDGTQEKKLLKIEENFGNTSFLFMTQNSSEIRVFRRWFVSRNRDQILNNNNRDIVLVTLDTKMCIKSYLYLYSVKYIHNSIFLQINSKL